MVSTPCRSVEGSPTIASRQVGIGAMTKQDGDRVPVGILYGPIQWRAAVIVLRINIRPMLYERPG